MKHSSQRGYSLVELSIVLAIIAIVIAGAITGVQSILRTNSVNNTVTQTNAAVGRIIAKMIRDSDFSGATLENLTKAGYDVWQMGAVTDAGTSTASVVHPLGGKVFVGVVGADEFGVSKSQGLVYALTGVPIAACTDLALGLESLAPVMTIVNEAAITTAATSVGAAAAVVKNVNNNTKLTASGAATKCGGNASTATIKLLIPRS